MIKNEYKKPLFSINRKDKIIEINSSTFLSFIFGFSIFLTSFAVYFLYLHTLPFVFFLVWSTSALWALALSSFVKFTTFHYYDDKDGKVYRFLISTIFLPGLILCIMFLTILYCIFKILHSITTLISKAVDAIIQFQDKIVLFVNKNNSNILNRDKQEKKEVLYRECPKEHCKTCGSEIKNENM